MKINPIDLPAFYVEFLDHFLDILQDFEQQNAATLFSGFLRADRLPNVIAESLGWDTTFIPLSAVKKAGLIDANFCFITSHNARDDEKKRKIRSIGFWLDNDRLEADLSRLHVNKAKYSQVQQLIIVTACQEAKNRVIDKDPRFLNISDEGRDSELLIDLLRNLDARALGTCINDIEFLTGTTEPTEESFFKIVRFRNDCRLGITTANAGTKVHGTLNLVGIPLMLPANMLIDLCDELIRTLTINQAELSDEQIQDRQAKLLLLALHSMILSIALNDRVLQDQSKKNVKRFYHEKQIFLGDKISVILPSFISQILDIIKGKMKFSHRVNYLQVLKDIKQIAATNLKELSPWVLKSSNFLGSSPSCIRFLREALDLPIEIFQEPSELKDDKVQPIQRRRTESCFAQAFLTFFPSTPIRTPLESPSQAPEPLAQVTITSTLQSPTQEMKLV